MLSLFHLSRRADLLSFAGWTFAFQTLFVLPWLLRSSLGASSTLLLAFVCTAVGRLGLGAASWLPPTPTVVASYVILNLGQGLTSTILKALVGLAASDDRRGLLLGLLSSCEKLAGVLAPLAGGPIYGSTLGHAAPAFASALVAFLGAATVWASAALLRGVEKTVGAKPLRVEETPKTSASMGAQHAKTE